MLCISSPSGTSIRSDERYREAQVATKSRRNPPRPRVAPAAGDERNDPVVTRVPEWMLSRVKSVAGLTGETIPQAWARIAGDAVRAEFASLPRE